MSVPLASCVMALGLAAPSADGGARKLNAPLARAPGGDVVEARYTPDGSRFLFRADRERDEVFELYSVPAAGGGSPVKLNGPLAAGEIVRSGFQVIPGGLVLFEVGPNNFSNGRLFSAPANGSSAAVELMGVSASVVRASFDGAFLVFRQGAELVAMLADGSAPAFALHSPPSGGFASTFEVSPAANQVVYAASASAGGTANLFAVDIAQGAVPIQLTAFTSGGLAEYSGNPFQISPDGATVVYRADERADEDYELFGVPIGGGTAVVLSGSIASGSFMDVLAFGIDPTSSRVLFDVGPDGPFSSLYSAPLDGSGSPVRLYWGVGDWRIDPTGQRAVFRNTTNYPLVTRTDLHSAPIDGSSAAETIGGGALDFQINAQGARVAFSSFDGISRTRLVSAPIASGAGPAAVTLPTSAQGAQADYQFSPDGTTVVYRTDLDVPGRVELYSAPSTTGVPVKLNDPLPAGGHVESLVVAPSSGDVSFVADLGLPSVFEAFSVPLAGGTNTRQSGSMPFNNLLGTVSAFRASNRRAVYIAHPGDPDHAQLFSVSFKGGAHVLALGGGQLVDPERLELTPDGKRVLYLTTNTSPTGEVELFSTPTDSSSPPVRLGRDMEADGASAPFRLHQDGKFVVFLSDRRTEDQRELYAGPSDGSFPAVRLSGALQAGGDVVDFALAPDASAVVYLADQTTDDVFELFSRTLAAPPVRISGDTMSGDVTSFQVSPDGTFVVYLADQTTDDVFELFRAPIDGSSAPMRLNSALPFAGDVLSFQISPDGTRVVYLADQLVNGRNELFSAPSDASSSPVRLNDPLPSNGAVQDGYQLRSGIVAFMASIPLSGIGLFVAPIDGSAPATALATSVAPIYTLQSFQLTPDGTRAVFISGPGAFYHLHGVPTDGSSDPYRIDAGPDSSGKVYAFAISGDGEHVAYLEAADGHDVRELVLARTDGLATPYRINRPLGPLGDVSPDFRFTPDGTHLLFRAEDQDPDAFELFVRTIDGRIAAAAGPDE